MKKVVLILIGILTMSCGHKSLEQRNPKVYRSIQEAISYGDPFHWFNMRQFAYHVGMGRVEPGDTVWSLDSCYIFTCSVKGSYGVGRVNLDSDCDRPSESDHNQLSCDTIFAEDIWRLRSVDSTFEEVR